MGGYPGVKMSFNGNSAITLVNPSLALPPQWGFTPSWTLGIVCTLSSGGSLTYAVQVTADQMPSQGGNWNNHDTLVGLTASANGNINYPITGLRLSVTNYVSGSINLGVAQWP